MIIERRESSERISRKNSNLHFKQDGEEVADMAGTETTGMDHIRLPDFHWRDRSRTFRHRRHIGSYRHKIPMVGFIGVSH